MNKEADAESLVEAVAWMRRHGEVASAIGCVLWCANWRCGCPQDYYRGACPNKLEERQDWLGQQLFARPQDVVLKPGAVDYAVQEFGRERQPALSGLSSELGRPRKRKANWRPN